MKEKINKEGEVITINKRDEAKRIFDSIDIAETTKRDYKQRIDSFLGYIGDNNLNCDSFLDYKHYLGNRNDLTVATKNKYLASAKVFLRELFRKGYLPVDITQNVKGFKQGKKHKREGLQESDVEALMEKMSKMTDTKENSRIKAILSLLLLQGLRQIEISRLDYLDLDLINNIAYVKGKGDDDKEIVYLHPETAKCLKRYLKNNKIACGALFVSNSNNSRKKRLSTRGIRKIVKKVFSEAGIDKNIHGCRHYFTTKLIKEYKGDLLEVAGYTRHKSVEMLQVYNDNIRKKEDLPRFYETFKDLKIS
jgi:integrase